MSSICLSFLRVSYLHSSTYLSNSFRSYKHFSSSRITLLRLFWKPSLACVSSVSIVLILSSEWATLRFSNYTSSEKWMILSYRAEFSISLEFNFSCRSWFSTWTSLSCSLRTSTYFSEALLMMISAFSSTENTWVYSVILLIGDSSSVAALSPNFPICP